MGSSHSHVEDDLRREKDEAWRQVKAVCKQAEEAFRNARQAQCDADQARNNADQAQRDAQDARNQAQQDSNARMEAERLEREARQREADASQREQDAQRAKDEAERTARSWEQKAAEAEKARKEAEEARKAAEERLMRGIPPDLRPTSEQLHQFREHYGYGAHALNIAITGESGVGKSALLNAVRGLWPDDPGAAAVGVNETTAVVQGYIDPHHPQVKWFDVPGANTPNVSDWLYFMNQNLYIFDALVILFSDRFTQTVGTLLSNAQRCGIPTYLVRTKADQLTQNIKNDRRRVNSEEAKRILIDETCKTVNDNLQHLKLPSQRVYIVSAQGMRQWVTDRDASMVIDEEEMYQMIFPGAMSDGKDGEQSQ